MLKFQIFLVILFSQLSNNNLFAQLGNNQIDQIKKVLENPEMTFKLNQSLNDSIYKKIDTYFNKNLNFKFTKKQIDKGLIKNQVTKVILSQDLKIINSQINVIKTDTPITVNYYADPKQRYFKKEYRKPTKKQLEKSEVEKISREFILDNKFIYINERDKLGDADIATRKLDSYNPNNEIIDKFNILQRAVFGREFKGKIVVNSRQIVDIYPETKEILSYKSHNWTPVDEKTGEIIPYKSINRIKSEIEKNLNFKFYKVENVSDGFFQSDSLLIPILIMDISTLDSTDNGSEEQTYLLFLPEKLDMPEELKVTPPNRAKQ